MAGAGQRAAFVPMRSPYLLATLELERHDLLLRCADCRSLLIAWSASETRSREHLLLNLSHHKQVCEGKRR